MYVRPLEVHPKPSIRIWVSSSCPIYDEHGEYSVRSTTRLKKRRSRFVMASWNGKSLQVETLLRNRQLAARDKGRQAVTYRLLL